MRLVMSLIWLTASRTWDLSLGAFSTFICISIFRGVVFARLAYWNDRTVVSNERLQGRTFASLLPKEITCELYPREVAAYRLLTEIDEKAMEARRRYTLHYVLYKLWAICYCRIWLHSSWEIFLICSCIFEREKHTHKQTNKGRAQNYAYLLV